MDEKSMHFLIDLKRNERIDSAISIETTVHRLLKKWNKNKLFIFDGHDHISYQKISFSDSKAWAVILGDPVYHDKRVESTKEWLFKKDFGRFIREVDGFYYVFYSCPEESIFVAGSSLFNILPIYYCMSKKHIIISSSLDMIRCSEGIEFTTDHQYYLEKALFNYPFLDRTPLKDIKSVPTNCLAVYDGVLTFPKHTRIDDYFVQKPKPWRESLNHLSELFIKKAGNFMPENRFCATLTGGLDGRALVGTALALNKDFFTYSYGSTHDKDIKIPLCISQKMAIPYTPLILDEEYSKKHFWTHGIQFTKKSFGLGNISRGHYNYALESVLNSTSLLISGNFGSEIIRSMKIPGVMTSEMIFRLFEWKTEDNLRSLLLGYPGLKFISHEIIHNCMKDLLEEIVNYLSGMPEHLTQNQKFYIYLFEHVFPKYFGPEIIVQRSSLNHRAPFLSFAFIEELLKTGVAGANSDFRETNPFKRYHGQAIYAHILKKTTPRLLDIELDKGYRPRSFITPLGHAGIALGYASKKIFRKRNNDIPDYKRLNIESNINRVAELKIDHDIFKSEAFKDKTSYINHAGHFINNLSAAIYQQFLTYGNDKY